MCITHIESKSTVLSFKLNIQKTKITASGPITSWQVDGETVKTVSDFIFWAPKSLQMVTAAMKLKDILTLKLGIISSEYLRAVVSSHCLNPVGCFGSHELGQNLRLK